MSWLEEKHEQSPLWCYVPWYYICTGGIHQLRLPVPHLHRSLSVRARLRLCLLFLRLRMCLPLRISLLHIILCSHLQFMMLLLLMSLLPDIHPALMVPSDAPYAQYCKNLLRQPDRKDRPPNTYWFKTDNVLERSVSDTIKGLIHRTTFGQVFCEKMALVYWRQQAVKKALNDKAKLRLKNIISYWNEKWLEIGNDAKPIYISDNVWSSPDDGPDDD
ncbi:hypothetical protein DY000_02048292 [Brassica cretica]|uniref:EDS1 EP domain-containing protein n=1 Tax=Brassica cretica TaxID=69181 RepID=A0ABQ7ENT0_BRACR|nr:hypothetical protein DY000_02048292 [Brassica cretica]